MYDWLLQTLHLKIDSTAKSIIATNWDIQFVPTQTKESHKSLEG